MNYDNEADYQQAMADESYHEQEMNAAANYAEYEQMQNESEISAKSLVALFSTTREQRASLAMKLLDDIEQGRANVLQVHTQLKSMEQVLNMLLNKKDFPITANQYSKFLLDEAAKYGKTFEMHNAKFTTKEAGVKYDFSKCNDSVYADLEAQKKALDEKIKERETYLKNIPESGVESVDKETGEVSVVYRAAKSSTTSLSVTLN